MRKASKKRIDECVAAFEKWKQAWDIDKRLASVHCKVGQRNISKWLRDIKSEVQVGQFTICTRALARSVVRALEDFESGYYTHGLKGGGFACKVYKHEVKQ
jgi:hypothetical protein